MTQHNRPLEREQHFNRLRQWLEMEGQAERQRLEVCCRVQSSAEAERPGETLLDMVIQTHTTGLGGRYLLTVQKRHQSEKLP